MRKKTTVLILLSACFCMGSHVLSGNNGQLSASNEQLSENEMNIQQRPATLRDKMTEMEKKYEISFVYDSVLPVDEVYLGGNIDGLKMDQALEKMFEKSSLSWKRQKKYVILTLKQEEIKAELGGDVQEQRDTLTESLISTDRVLRKNRTQTGLTRLDKKRFNNGFAFMSSPDVIKTLQQLSGVATGTELMSGLFVHGGTGSDNLYLLDGVPLYQASHLAGLFSSFNTDIVESLDFYKSGFPARYGGRLSSVVDVKTSDGSFYDYSGVFSIGLIDTRVQFGGPIVKGKTSFNVAARRSWLDIVTTPVMAIMNAKKKSKDVKSGFGYAFWDFNGRISHLFNDNSKLSFNIYYGHDALTLKSISDLNVIMDGNETQTKKGTSYVKTGWGNVITSLNWYKHLDNDLNISMSTYYTMYNSNLGFIEKTWDAAQFELYDEKYSSKIQDAGYRADFDWKLGRVNHLRFGLNYQYHFYSPYYKLTEKEESDGTVIMENNEKTNIFHNGHEAALYLEDELHIARWLDANIGLRYVLFGVKDKIWHSFEPRVALNFNISKSVCAKVSYVKMSQFSHQISTVNMDIPTCFWTPSTKTIAPMHSHEFAAGVYSKLPHNIYFNIEGFYKRMFHLWEYGGKKTLYPSLNTWEQSMSEGKGVAYGLETEVGWKTEKLDLKAYYTLSWSKRKFDDFSRDWFLDKNDSRHKFTINATYRFNDKIEAYAAWNYSTGTRFTIPSHHTDYEGMSGHNIGYNADYLLFSKPNNAKLPDYHRLDVGVNFHRVSKKRGLEQVWNLSVYNVYCRMNAITAYVATKPSGDGRQKYVGIAEGMIPIIPSFSYTVKF